MISNENTVRKFVSQNIYIVNIVLILCHLAFSVIYRNFGMTILFYENLFSIVLCVLAFIFLKKKLIKHYVYLAFIELYIFIIITRNKINSRGKGQNQSFCPHKVLFF